MYLLYRKYPSRKRLNLTMFLQMKKIFLLEEKKKRRRKYITENSNMKTMWILNLHV